MKFFSLFSAIRARLTSIALSLLCVFIVLLSCFFYIPVISGLTHSLNSFIYDKILTLYPHQYKELARVVIIDIDNISLNREGRWPWPRDKLAQLLLKLQEAGVVVVGVDIIMSAPEINYAIGLKEKLNYAMPELTADKQYLNNLLEKIAPKVDNDQQFAASMKDYDVSLGFLFHDLSKVKTGMLPAFLKDEKGAFLKPEAFNAHVFHGYNASLSLFIKAASGHGGFVTNIPDLDSIVRQGLVLASIDDRVYPSLALQIVMRYLLANYVNLKINKSIFGKKLYGIDVGGTFIPTNSSGQILIPFWGPPYTLPYYSATNILQGKIGQSSLEGSIAILGSSAVMLGDLHASPVAKLFPGVEMVGNMVSAMLGQQISTLYDWVSIEGFLIILLTGCVFALISSFLNLLLLFTITFVLLLVTLAISIFLFFSYNLYVPVASLLFLFSLQALVNYSYNLFLEKNQKFRIRQLFGQYVPDSYVKELLAAPESSTMEGQSKEMTVLFSDIRGFTDVSESLDAAEVKKLLNIFFTPLTKIIFDHHGTIDKYVGDMIVAFWGAPIPIENNKHAYLAILTVLCMFKELPKINDELIGNGLPAVNFGVGLGTGIMNVGDMGSAFRRSYTVLGDVVNLTSRLEGLTKFYGVNILVSEVTRKNQDNFLWRTIDKIIVKGRKASLIIYEPVGLLDEISPECLLEVQQYHLALDKYYRQDWLVAEKLFKNLQEKYPNTGLYELYSSRISVYKSNPPSEEWNGVYKHTSK